VSQKDISKVTVVDIENKFVAYSGPFKEGVRDVVCQWDRIFILTNDGKVRLDIPEFIQQAHFELFSFLASRKSLLQPNWIFFSDNRDIHWLLM
jgi:hypothetical protein